MTKIPLQSEDAFAASSLAWAPFWRIYLMTERSKTLSTVLPSWASKGLPKALGCTKNLVYTRVNYCSLCCEEQVVFSIQHFTVQRKTKERDNDNIQLMSRQQNDP